MSLRKNGMHVKMQTIHLSPRNYKKGKANCRKNKVGPCGKAAFSKNRTVNKLQSSGKVKE